MPIVRLSFTVVTMILLAACATDGPHYGDVVTLKADDASARSGYPPPGTVWRLEENDLRALSPAPFVEPPPPPKLPPPPRPNDPPPPPAYYGPHYYEPYWHWGPGFYYWRRW